MRRLKEQGERVVVVVVVIIIIIIIVVVVVVVNLKMLLKMSLFSQNILTL